MARFVKCWKTSLAAFMAFRRGEPIGQLAPQVVLLPERPLLGRAVQLGNRFGIVSHPAQQPCALRRVTRPRGDLLRRAWRRRRPRRRRPRSSWAPMAALRQPPAACTAVVEAPRRTSSEARPRRPECDETPSKAERFGQGAGRGARCRPPPAAGSRIESDHRLGDVAIIAIPGTQSRNHWSDPVYRRSVIGRGAR